jgi:hypothetical protein
LKDHAEVRSRPGLANAVLISSQVRELANFHRRHTPALAAFIELANTDELIEKIGKRHYAQIALDFRLLLERKDEFVHTDPERASETSFTIIYGSLARFLGLGGGARDAMGEGDWKILLEDLTLMTRRF